MYKGTEISHISHVLNEIRVERVFYLLDALLEAIKKYMQVETMMIRALILPHLQTACSIAATISFHN